MKQRGRGRPRVYNTPEQFNKGIDEYVEECEETGDFPGYSGLLLHMGLSQADIDERLARKDRDAMEYQKALDRALLIRKSWLEKRMVTDGKSAKGCMDALKQPINGGYQDRPTDTATPEIKINLVGIGGESAFK